ncbi:transcription factor Pcc1-domain-containing protein [Cercophora scortea]|uniref:Transcription factor Pcc1-domain-containing protein n=1 Tax=Cercophora scortea TaxID=314031 RepID=A0AAE0J2K5_9PEZI|nr:transcription factor Pcc1-domain-containing protein [Cercophora scortea]
MATDNSSPEEFPCSLTLNIPFPDARLASVALRALKVDKELSALVQRDLSTATAAGSEEETILHVKYRATTNRMLRVAVNSFMESVALVLEVMEELDVDVLEAGETSA